MGGEGVNSKITAWQPSEIFWRDDNHCIIIIRYVKLAWWYVSAICNIMDGIKLCTVGTLGYQYAKDSLWQSNAFGTGNWKFILQDLRISQMCCLKFKSWGMSCCRRIITDILKELHSFEKSDYLASDTA